MSDMVPLPLQQLPERKASAWLGVPAHSTSGEPPGADIDRLLHAWVARFSAHVSPTSLILAFVDWGLHLQVSPSKQQELLSEMLGVRRSSVSEIAKRLQTAGLIRYSRGTIEIVNRAGLEAAACECYALISGKGARIEP